MSFLTENALKDRLSHTNDIESVQQHKYARLATASYFYSEKEKVEELFNKMSELKDFELDDELSTEEHSVFFNKTTNETVISYRGTTNLGDVKTDSHILMGREKHTQRYQNSEAVYEKTRDKYRSSVITTTGHSLGGGISLHIAEKYDIQGHHFNPAISATQVFTTDHYNNQSHQTIYRTKLDPVSIGGEIIADHQQNRTVVTVNNDENSHAHAMTNFYSDNAKRTKDNKSFQVRKESLKTTINRHKTQFKRLYDAYKKAQNIEEYLDSINAERSIFTKLPKALPKAIAMAKRNASPHEYANETARSLNPFFGFIPDPNFQWDDDDVIGPLYHLGQAMRTPERKRQDQLINLGERSPHQQFTEVDEHHILSASGVTYNEVMGQNMPRMTSQTPTTPTTSARSAGTDLPPRRRPTEDYQVIDPSEMEGTYTSLTEGRLAYTLRSNPTVLRNLEGFRDTDSRISDPMSSSYVPPSERLRRIRRVGAVRQQMFSRVGRVEITRNPAESEIAQVLRNPLGTPD